MTSRVRPSFWRAYEGLHLTRIFGTYRRFPNLLYRRFPNRQAIAVANTISLSLRAGKETRDTADWEVCGTGLGGSIAVH